MNFQVIEATELKRNHFLEYNLLVSSGTKINRVKKKALESKSGKMVVYIKEILPKAKLQDGGHFIMLMVIYSKANLKKE